MTTSTQRHFVELNELENTVLKTAFMVFMGVLTKQEALVMIGAIGGAQFLQELGEDGLNRLVEKMEAHKIATAGDGSIKDRSEIIAQYEAQQNLNGESSDAR